MALDLELMASRLEGHVGYLIGVETKQGIDKTADVLPVRDKGQKRN